MRGAVAVKGGSRNWRCADRGASAAWRRRCCARRMHAFKAEGLQHAMLGVDTQNLSGALRVYESVGFKPIKRYIQFEKGV